MRIALDYDNTFTLDPPAWRDFVFMMTKRGHTVFIVTMRSALHDWIDPKIVDMIRIIYCDGRPKKEVCDQLGWAPHVWIDDHPETIHMGSTLTPEMLDEWRKNGRQGRGDEETE